MKKLLTKSIVFIFAIAISLGCVLLWEKLNIKPKESVEVSKDVIFSPLQTSPKIQETSNSDICKEIDEYNVEFRSLVTPAKGTINGGVLNGKACLIEPEFPKDAQAKDLDGKVLVEVLVNEYGKVVKAKAIKGNSIFYKVAEKAAIKSRIKHFFLGGESVRVNGILLYDFVRQ